MFPEHQGSSRRWQIQRPAQEPPSSSLFAGRAAQRPKPKAVPVIPPAAAARGKKNSLRSGWEVAKPCRRPLRWLRRPASAPRAAGLARVSGIPGRWRSPRPTCEMRPGAAEARRGPSISAALMSPQVLHSPPFSSPLRAHLLLGAPERALRAGSSARPCPPAVHGAAALPEPARSKHGRVSPTRPSAAPRKVRCS